jgi:uncharacterized protein YndB with AHSA1/START domain
MHPMTAEPATVQVRRTIAAAPERVYRAWLDPELLRQWLAPRSLEVTRAEVDPRVGGQFRVWQASPEGEAAGGFQAEVLELEENRRLVFRWGMVGPERLAGPAFDSVLTIELRDTGDGTELTLTHERLEELYQAMPDLAADFPIGWEQALDKLVEALDAHL